MIGCTCASSSGSSESTPASATDNMETPSIETIARSEVKACLDEGGHVALVSVTKATVIRPGTRGEQTNIEVTIEEVIYGTLTETAQLTRYTSGGDLVLQEGHRYMVALTPVPRFMPRLLLGGFVEVPQDQTAAYVEAHRNLIADLGY